MAELDRTVLKGAYDVAGAQLAAPAAALSTNPAAPDTFLSTGKEILVVRNPQGSGAAGDVTVVSVADQLQRTGDIVKNIPEGEEFVWGPMKQAGWVQPGGAANAGAIEIYESTGVPVGLEARVIVLP